MYDKKFSEILLAAQDEAKQLDDTEVTSEHVFLAILADTDESNKIRKVFNKAGGLPLGGPFFVILNLSLRIKKASNLSING